MGALPVLDQYGQPALWCAADQAPMALVAGSTSVAACPRCGHRTDEPGEGVLGDGFDVIHRQWGTRGDPHAWSALRDLVARTPTPTTPDAVRAAYVDGLSRVIGVDVDSTDEAHVRRDELHHGGMSGGMVDVGWWRSKGIPLLVDRALERRPLAPADAVPPVSPISEPDGARGVRKVAASVAIWAVMLAIPAALIGGGGWLLYERAYGTQVDATVLSCDSSGHVRRYGSTFRTDCVAEWTIDGETVVGNFEGGNGAADVGRTVDATVRGDTAYSRSLGLALLLIVLGVPFLVPPVFAVRRHTSGDRPPAA